MIFYNHTFLFYIKVLYYILRIMKLLYLKQKLLATYKLLGFIIFIWSYITIFFYYILINMIFYNSTFLNFILNIENHKIIILKAKVISSL